MLIDPQKCVLGGGLYWATVAVPELGTNTYFHIQHHQFQPEAGVFHSLVSSYRKIVKSDAHSDMTYRIISIRAPYYIIACAKTLPEIISDWSFLERYLFWPWSERIMPFLSETNPVSIDQLKERILILQQLQQNPATQEPNEDLLQVMRRESNSNNQTQNNQGTTTAENGGSNECSICMSENVNTAFVPCGHATACQECARQLPNNRCPICRADITQVIRIYLTGAS